MKGHIFGVGESVFITNTTSKKPGDFQEVFENDLHVYEVTTKKVDDQRLVESGNAVFDFLKQNESQIEQVLVTFLCRSEDVQVTDIDQGGRGPLLGTLTHKNIQYEFINIWAWIIIMLDRLGPGGREIFFGKLREYIELPATHLDVKSKWRELISNID
jgi:hypothetical protein